jgi:ferritin
VADLEVDLGLLGETAGSLGMLLHEFQRAADIVEDAESAIGRNALLDEMREFVDEWTHKREKLVESINAVYQMATQSQEAFVQVDNDLARSIQTATEAGGR